MGIQACSQSFQKGNDKIGGPSTTLRGRLSWEVYQARCVYYWSNKIPWISSFSTFNGNTIVLFIVIRSPGYLD